VVVGNGATGTVIIMDTNDPTHIDVRERLPQWLSPSAADTYKQCPRQFYYRYVVGIRSGGTIHTLRGNLAHTVFERIFDHPRAERTVEMALTYVRPAIRVTLQPFLDREDVTDAAEIAIRDEGKLWLGEQAPDSKGYRRAADGAADAERILAEYDFDELVAELEQLVRNWFTMEDPTGFDPAGRETFVRARSAGVPLQGFIDRLDKITTASGEEVWVISDFKTGKVVDDRWVGAKFFQLRVYALLLRELHGVTPRLLRLLYVKGEGKECVKKLPITDEVLDRTQAELKAIWSAIQADARTNTWRTSPSKLCPWCDFEKACPEFAGGGSGLLLPEERELYGIE
jgi:putative RecB family exonuclease